MAQIFGNYIDADLRDREYLTIGFSPSSIPLQQRWRNNGLSADFLADYLSTFFPGEDAATVERTAEIKDAVSFIANELLENAMKFSYFPSHHSISITMQLEANSVNFYVRNCVAPQAVEGFQRFIQKLLQEDPADLYMEQLTDNIETEKGNNASGLGFLTMLNDYNAVLAWKFETTHEHPELTVVTTMVRLVV